MAVLAAGCVPARQGVESATVDGTSALVELERRNQRWRTFRAEMEVQWFSREGTVKSRGSIEFSEPENCRIRMAGPLGVSWVLVDMDSQRCRINLPQAGHRIELYPDEPLDLPGFDLRLPAARLLATLLSPLPAGVPTVIWARADRPANAPTKVTLLPVGASSGLDSLVLSLDFRPVRVDAEEGWVDGNRVYRREFHYRRPEDLMPERTTVTSGGIQMAVLYRRLKRN